MSPQAWSGPQAGSPARVLILGGGGREHALAWSLAREAAVETVIVAPGSDAIGAESKVRCVPGVSAADPAAVLALATEEDVDLVVVGPEAPLAAGVVDVLEQAGVPTFGPIKAAARIEWSKAFCREVAAAAGVRMARGEAFWALQPALAFARELAAAPGSRGVVVKADGLMGGKGVTVCDDFAGAETALRALFAGRPAADDTAGAEAARVEAEADRARGKPPVVVLEERLAGPEASLIALCDDHGALALPAARDHKRLLDDDRGPNTGGMGAYSPVPDLPDGLCATLVDMIHLPILAELNRRGAPFRGALYAGLMLTPEGPVLIECNARFGDPEVQALLPRLAAPLGPLLLGAALGDLAGAAARLGLVSRTLPTTGDAAVAIVLAAADYPEAPRRGDAIDGLAEAVRAGAIVFHAGTVLGDDGRYRTNGGRVLSVVGLGANLAAARSNAEKAADRIAWQGMQRRRDIAARLPVAADSRAAAASPAPIATSGWGGEAAS
ncbi:MAG: phosphoribosylamine--glycine ligase [Candidatus Limnocylindrales bacterium]|jgi:phosphoribosylamine--glycine ligase